MPYSNERLQEIYNYSREHGENETCAFFKIKHETLSRTIREYHIRFKTREGQDQYDYSQKEKHNFQKVVNNGAMELSLKTHEIKTIDELLAYAEIDTDLWEVWKSTTNVWGSSVNPNYQVKAWLKRKTCEIDIKKICSEVIERIGKYSKPSKIKRKLDKEGFLWEVGLIDHHVGQLSYDKEVGEDYDVDIAMRIAKEAVEFLCDKITPYKINKVLYIIGNDYLNVASSDNTTTGGTTQDEDGRYHRSFMCGVDIHVDAINRLKKVADVHVLQVPGNHSTEREFYLGSVLQAWYRGDENVLIDNSPMSRKYYRYGSNLLGFAHGDKNLKLDRLLGLMPLEAKKDWPLASNYEWHLGHLHHDAKMQHNLKSERGIKIRRLNTLIPLDAYHYNAGYVRIRETQSFLWHPTLGDMVHINYRIKEN
ncbi:MAG: hypothetical protein GY853_01790 [PVC group bacterium]|nr:hypothetical protein [PVC group bacterium]